MSARVLGEASGQKALAKGGAKLPARSRDQQTGCGVRGWREDGRDPKATGRWRGCQDHRFLPDQLPVAGLIPRYCFYSAVVSCRECLPFENSHVQGAKTSSVGDRTFFPEPLVAPPTGWRGSDYARKRARRGFGRQAAACANLGDWQARGDVKVVRLAAAFSVKLAGCRSRRSANAREHGLSSVPCKRPALAFGRVRCAGRAGNERVWRPLSGKSFWSDGFGRQTRSEWRFRRSAYPGATIPWHGPRGTR